MDSLLPQKFKSRLLIPGCDSSYNSDEDRVNKKYVDLYFGCIKRL